MPDRLSPIKLESYKPLREIVFEALREAIMSGRLRPGERMMEVQLAEELGVSRTPVREAIRKLELEGFAVMIPRKGAYVSDLSIKDIADVFEIRGALEALASGLAAERISPGEMEELERLLVQVSECAEDQDLDRLVDIDTQFHAVLYRASRNDRLAQMINTLWEQVQRFRRTTMGSPGRMRETLEEHRKIVDAIADRNVNLANALAIEHMENAENRMLEAVRLQSIAKKDNL
ncbi:MAG: GntR family transcriptional regulator [Syntrophomonadaceae bacterium]|nr:GntR family transcriptional regulator [Syntrophomonadaceae bacterium]